MGSVHVERPIPNFMINGPHDLRSRFRGFLMLKTLHPDLEAICCLRVPQQASYLNAEVSRSWSSASNDICKDFLSYKRGPPHHTSYQSVNSSRDGSLSYNVFQLVS